MSAVHATPTVAARRLPAALSLALVLALPMLTARALCGAYADGLGDQIAVGLACALGPLSSALSPATSDDIRSDFELVDEPATARASGAPAKARHGAKHGSEPGVAHAIRISSAQVLSLASRRAMPGATPVHASAEHPAGLALHGVSALGVGLSDGDVLTEAAGQRASSVALVVGVVLAARARHSPVISGRFFRAGTPYVVTVEQPYPPGT